MTAAIVFVCAAAFGLPAGEIAFIGKPESGPARVHIVTLETNVIRDIGPDHAVGQLAWSPDGRRLAFAVEAPGGTSIHVINADGTGGRFIKNAQSRNAGPVWSQDGTLVAYTAGEGLDAQVMVANPDRDNEQPWGGGRTSVMSPVWTTHAIIEDLFVRVSEDAPPVRLPDLRSSASSPPALLAIGFVGTATRTTDIFLLTETEAIALDAQLLPSQGNYAESSVSISKDGIAFDSDDGGDREIFLIARRRTRDISNHAAADWRPLWSPNGSWIAFESFRGGTRGIYRCNSQSSRVLEVVASNSGDCWDAAWSPDSEWVAYTTNVAGIPGVHVVGANGREHVRVSPEGVPAGKAAWRPTP